jgi:hypothetical protein
MDKFVTTEVPAWRIALWGVVAALAVIALGFFSSGHFDYRVLLLGLFVGTLFSSFGFFLLWSARSGWTARYLKPCSSSLLSVRSCFWSGRLFCGRSDLFSMRSFSSNKPAAGNAGTAPQLGREHQSSRSPQESERTVQPIYKLWVSSFCYHAERAGSGTPGR